MASRLEPRCCRDEFQCRAGAAGLFFDIAAGADQRPFAKSPDAHPDVERPRDRDIDGASREIARFERFPLA